MLTLFRRIRKGLLGSSETKKYTLYAIGEIALVVIGILIALQINNRNEWRKDRADEKIAIVELSEDFQLDQKEYEEVRDKLVKIMISMALILEQSSMPVPNLSVQELNNHFTKIHDMPTYMGTDRPGTWHGEPGKRQRKNRY